MSFLFFTVPPVMLGMLYSLFAITSNCRFALMHRLDVNTLLLSGLLFFVQVDKYWAYWASHIHLDKLSCPLMFEAQALYFRKNKEI